MGLTALLIQQATAPLAQGLDTVAANTGVTVARPDPLGASTPQVPPVDTRIADAVSAALDLLSGVPMYMQVAGVRTNMRNEILRQRLNIVEPRLFAAEQGLASQQAVNDAQEAWLRELSNQVSAQTSATAEQKAYLAELAVRLDLVKASVQNVASDLAANQANDALLAARVTAAEARLTADELAIRALQASDASQTAALAANTAADQLNAAQDALTLATAQQALALGQAEHATNVAQQSQLDANSAQDALDRARQTTDEQAIAQAQATASAALQKATDDATLAQQALAAAQAAQATANTATSAAATAQASASSAATAAATAQTSANTAKTAADTAQAKAEADATAAAAAQATATAAQQAAAATATALTALQTTVASKLDASLVRRGSVATPAVTIQVLTPATVAVSFTSAFADANYEVFLSKPSSGLLGVELGAQNKTASGFTLTLRNTGAVSLAVTASTVDFFAIHN